MAAGSIVVDLLMRTGSFTTDTARASKQLKQFQKDVVSTAGSIKGQLVGALAAAGIALSFDALVQGAAKFKDLEEETGATAEDLASLSIVAATAGVEIESIAAAAIKLTKNLSGVDDESKAAGAALTALGIPIADFKKLNPVEQIDALSKAFNSFADGPEKSAVALALFGKAGAEQLKVFKALDEAGGRTVILTQAQIELADAGELPLNRRVVDPSALLERTGLQKAAPHFAWDRYFAGSGVPDVTAITVASPAFVKGLDKLVTATKPAVWQTYLRVHLLGAVAGLLPKRFDDAQFAFIGMLTGQAEQQARWKRCVAATDGALGDLTGQVFTRERFSAAAKQAAEGQVHAISAGARAKVEAVGGTIELLGQDVTNVPPQQRGIDEPALREGLPLRREDWAAYLAANKLPVPALLKDAVHQSDYGAHIINSNILVHFRVPQAFSSEPASREKTIQPEKQPDGSFTAKFTGTRIDLHGITAPDGGTFRVLIDEKPAREANAWLMSYVQPDAKNAKEGKGANPRDQSPHGITLGQKIVPQTWTLVMTSDSGDYTLTGSVTGASSTRMRSAS